MAPPPDPTLALRIKPNAKSAALRAKGDGWELSVTAPAVEGKANAAAVVALAGALEVPRSTVELVRGARSRDKVFAFRSLSAEALAARLESLRPK